MNITRGIELQRGGGEKNKINSQREAKKKQVSRMHCALLSSTNWLKLWLFCRIFTTTVKIHNSHLPIVSRRFARLEVAVGKNFVVFFLAPLRLYPFFPNQEASKTKFFVDEKERQLLLRFVSVRSVQSSCLIVETARTRVGLQCEWCDRLGWKWATVSVREAGRETLAKSAPNPQPSGIRRAHDMRWKKAAKKS